MTAAFIAGVAFGFFWGALLMFFIAAAVVARCETRADREKTDG